MMLDHSVRQPDPHIMLLFQRIGARRQGRDTGVHTLQLHTLRTRHQHLGISEMEMDECLKPLVLAGRTALTLQDFVTILHRISLLSCGALKVEPKNSAPISSSPPLTSRPDSGRPSKVAKMPIGDDFEVSLAKSLAAAYATDRVTYSSEVSNLLGTGAFDQGRPTSRNVDHLPVQSLANLTMEAMNTTVSRYAHRPRCFVDDHSLQGAFVKMHQEQETIQQPHANTLNSARRYSPNQSPARFSSLPHSARPPSHPMVPRCAGLAPQRRVLQREQAIKQRTVHASEECTAMKFSTSPSLSRPTSRAPSTRTSPQRPRNQQPSKPVTALQEDTTTSEQHSRRLDNEEAHGADFPHTSKPQQKMILRCESPRLLKTEDGGWEVSATEKARNPAFLKYRQYDTLITVQCLLRGRHSEIVKNRRIPSIRLLQRFGKGMNTRKRMRRLRIRQHLESLLLIATSSENPAANDPSPETFQYQTRPSNSARHAVCRVKPLPKLGEEELESEGAVLSDRSDPTDAPAPMPGQTYIKDGIVRDSTTHRPLPHYMLARSSRTRQPHPPPPRRRRVSPDNRNSPSSDASRKPKGYTTRQEILRRRNDAALVLQRYVRMYLAKKDLMHRQLWVASEVKDYELDYHVCVVQSFIVCIAAKYKIQYLLKRQARRSAAQKITKWARGRIAVLKLRQRQAAVRREMEYYEDFDKMHFAALSIALKWRGAKARRILQWRKAAAKRNIENRIAVERQQHALLLINRAARWALDRRRYKLRRLTEEDKKVKLTASVAKQEILHAASIIQKNCRLRFFHILRCTAIIRRFVRVRVGQKYRAQHRMLLSVKHIQKVWRGVIQRHLWVKMLADHKTALQKAQRDAAACEIEAIIMAAISERHVRQRLASVTVAEAVKQAMDAREAELRKKKSKKKI